MQFLANLMPAWLTIALTGIAIIILLNRTPPEDLRWFFRLRRPSWLTFERAIPLIWITILICGGWSAYVVWQRSQNWGFMAGFVLLEILIMSYTNGMCRTRSLRVGTVIGGAGFMVGVILAILIFPIAPLAVGLLLPYLLWSPIGTYVTWAMISLNPGAA